MKRGFRTTLAASLLGACVMAYAIPDSRRTDFERLSAGSRAPADVRALDEDLARPTATTPDGYQRRAAGPQLQLTPLDEIIAGLPAQAQIPPSMWERMWDWLGGFFEQRVDAGNFDWLRDLRFPATLASWIFYGASTVIVLAGLWERR